MLSLALTVVVAAGPAPRLVYEQKCLYCHSQAVAESGRRTEPQWRRLIERMRVKAPLLIGRADVDLLTRYISRELKLAVPGKPKEPVVTSTPATVTVTAPNGTVSPPTVTAPPLEPAPGLEPLPFPEPTRRSDPELEAQATELISRRCSRCHSLGRVYGRLDTFERSMTTLERMRLKTGSGITDADMELLERFLREQFDATDER